MSEPVYERPMEAAQSRVGVERELAINTAQGLGRLSGTEKHIGIHHAINAQEDAVSRLERLINKIDPSTTEKGEDVPTAHSEPSLSIFLETSADRINATTQEIIDLLNVLEEKLF